MVYSFGSFRPWSPGFIILELWQDGVSWHWHLGSTMVKMSERRGRCDVPCSLWASPMTKRLSSKTIMLKFATTCYKGQVLGTKNGTFRDYQDPNYDNDCCLSTRSWQFDISSNEFWYSFLLNIPVFIFWNVHYTLRLWEKIQKWTVGNSILSFI